MKRIGEQLPDRFNAAAYFLKRNLHGDSGEKVAFYHQDDTYSYRQVAAQTRRAATLLTGLGVERENRVALLLPDSPEFVFAFWGAVWMGAVPVPINTACTLDDIQYIVENTRAGVLLTNQAWLDKLSPVQSPFLKQVLLVDGDEPFVAQLAAGEEMVHPAATARDEPAFWLYTSGSTGRPKGVMHAHQSMVVSAQHFAQNLLGLTETDITYSIAKMPFAYGLGNTLYMPMAVGGAAVLSDAANAFDVVADIRRYRPTVLFGIPALYAGILAVQELTEPDFSSVRLCASAAEQLPRPIWQRWKQTFNLEICEGIGTTELLHIFLSNKPGECRPGSSGRPVPGYDVRVLDELGSPVQPGEIGFLHVGGESLMLGYWNRLKATREALSHETMFTGDKYLCDGEGYFYFMGRKDDFFKVNGMWVSPFEIEEALLLHPGVLDAAVVPASESGEGLTEVVAYVSLKSGFAVSSELVGNIRRQLRTALPPFKVPRSIRVLDQLPRTSTGKIHRKALLQLQQLV